MKTTRNPRGRPPKFEEAHRPITVTLPDRTLQHLAAINPDRARAIVKATESATRLNSKEAPPVEVVRVSPGEAVIVVGPSRYLRQLPWLRLVEIAPHRYLLALPSGTAIERLEVALEDIIEHLESSETYEQKLLAELHRVLRVRRRQKDVFTAEILLLGIGSQTTAKPASRPVA